MTTELEKQFFDMFGVEPKYKTCIFKYCKNKKEYDCENCNDREWHYPQITDHILLELLVIMQDFYFIVTSVEELKEDVLKYFIRQVDDYKPYVQALFKE